MTTQVIKKTKTSTDVAQETSRFSVGVIMTMAGIIGIWAISCLIGGSASGGFSVLISGISTPSLETEKQSINKCRRSNNDREKSSRLVPAIMLSFGALVCLWVAAATMVGALHQANWQVSELARQYMLATGMMRPMHTLVDFYSHIKESSILSAWPSSWPSRCSSST